MVYHASPAGLYKHGQKLLDLFNAYPPDNPVTFDAVPVPPEGTVDKDGRYHEIRTDEWGTEWEHLIYGVWGHPRKYPFNSWEEGLETYQFPPAVLPDKALVAEQRKNYLVFSGWPSIFERLCALRPIDQTLMDILTEDPAMLQFLDRLVAYWMTVIDGLIDADVDVIMFGDDWHPDRSHDSANVVAKSLPRYAQMMAPIKRRQEDILSCLRFSGRYPSTI